jgi:hypothetical protein
MGGAGGAVDAGVDIGSGGCPGVYCDDFESDAPGAIAAGWTRVGGSNGDWAVVMDGTRVLAQDTSVSATPRFCDATGAAGAPWAVGTSISAQVMVTTPSTSGSPAALVCLNYVSGTGDYYCLALLPGMGAQLRARISGTVTMSAVLATSVTVGTPISVMLSVDTSGMLSASVGGAPVGTYAAPGVLAAGFAAVGTQNAEASFDDVVVTRP